MFFDASLYVSESNRIIPSEKLVMESVRVLLQHMCPDIEDQHLADTPMRVSKALYEMTSGYREDPKHILSRVFIESYDELIVVKGIPFVSLCAHHLLSFVGTVDIGYLPNGKVVGLSKLPRLVDCFAKRLQIQERMTKEIAEAIKEHLQPKGVAVIVRASHSCLACRGIKKSGVVMVTSCMLGAFRDDCTLRGEFLELCK